MDEFEKEASENEINEAVPNENSASNEATENENAIPDEKVEKEEINPNELFPEKDESGEVKDYVAELEQIREMFQQEYEKASEDYLAGGDMQEVEGEESSLNEDTEPEEEKRLCECCGEREPDTERGEDYPYCSECRELMAHYPLGAKGIIAFLLVLVIGFGTVFVMFSKNNTVLDSCLTAEEYLRENKLYSALCVYNYDVLQGMSSTAVPKKQLGNMAKAFGEMGNTSYAVSTLSSYYSDLDKKLPWNSFFLDLEKDNAVMEKINTLLADYTTQEVDGEKMIEEINGKLDELKKDEDIGEYTYYIDFYKYIVMRAYNASVKEQYEFLSSVYEAYPDRWTLCVDLCSLASKLDNLDDAIKYADIVLANNSEEITVFAYLADAVRFSKEPNTKKMIEYANSAEKNMSQQDAMSYMKSDVLRIKVLAYLLDGDTDSAWTAAQEMFTIVYNNNYNVNNLFPCLYTYAVCANECGETEEYDSILSLLYQNGISLPDDISKYVEGDTKLSAVITDKEGSLA